MLSRSSHHQIHFTAITGVARRRVERLIALGEDRPPLNSRRAGEAFLHPIFGIGSGVAVARHQANRATALL